MIDEDGKIYLTYTAFDGWGSVRIALSSIAKDDFVNRRWRWSAPVFLSPPGEVHKNWVLFPEKINGKFAILHSLSPKILIDYVDDLSEFEDDAKNIKSHYSRFSNVDGWDSWVRGAGPPPIKTKLGWLLLYHAMDVRDPNRYKLGAMILDADDPTKILYRSRIPSRAGRMVREYRMEIGRDLFLRRRREGWRALRLLWRSRFGCLRGRGEPDHFLDELVRNGMPAL